MQLSDLFHLKHTSFWVVLCLYKVIASTPVTGTGISAGLLMLLAD
jgi:hypothetical protein